MTEGPWSLLALQLRHIGTTFHHLMTAATASERVVQAHYPNGPNHIVHPHWCQLHVQRQVAAGVLILLVPWLSNLLRPYRWDRPQRDSAAGCKIRNFSMAFRWCKEWTDQLTLLRRGQCGVRLWGYKRECLSSEVQAAQTLGEQGSSSIAREVLKYLGLLRREQSIICRTSLKMSRNPYSRRVIGAPLMTSPMKFTY